MALILRNNDTNQEQKPRTPKGEEITNAVGAVIPKLVNTPMVKYIKGNEIHPIMHNLIGDIFDRLIIFLFGSLSGILPYTILVHPCTLLTPEGWGE